jgi:predicted transcriptional regulator of viral defense system
LDEHLLKLAVAQSGAVSSVQVLDAGRSYRHLSTRERSGKLVRVRKGLYVHAGFPSCWLQDLWLEQLAAGPRSAACGRSAAALRGLRNFRERTTVEVARVQGGNHQPVRGTVHETFWLPSRHVTHVDGLPVTTVARTVFDLAVLPRHPMAFRNPGLREIHT